MNIKQNKKNKNLFKVESSEKGNFYDVDLEKKTCTCMHFLLRLRNTGQLCKHLLAVQEKFGVMKKEKKESILKYLEKRKEIDSIELIEKFGERVVNEALKNGIIIEEKGRIKLLK